MKLDFKIKKKRLIAQFNAGLCAVYNLQFQCLSVPIAPRINNIRFR